VPHKVTMKTASEPLIMLLVQLSPDGGVIKISSHDSQRKAVPMKTL